MFDRCSVPTDLILDPEKTAHIKCELGRGASNSVAAAFALEAVKPDYGLFGRHGGARLALTRQNLGDKLVRKFKIAAGRAIGMLVAVFVGLIHHGRFLSRPPMLARGLLRAIVLSRWSAAAWSSENLPL
jgi:hypothetical protein